MAYFPNKYEHPLTSLALKLGYHSPVSFSTGSAHNKSLIILT